MYGCVQLHVGNSMKYTTPKSLKGLFCAAVMSIFIWSAATLALAQSASPNMPHSKGMQSLEGSHDMKSPMMTHMDKMQKMSMSGDVDKDFAMMMKMHHEHSVEMAKMELAHGKSPEMKKVAKQIIASQKKEVIVFDRWLAR